MAVLSGAYALGCVVTGYYLVLWRTGKDLRKLGSGSLGATNVGRILGRTGYVLTSLLDMAKGVGAIFIARWAGLTDWPLGLTALAVVAGHNWPIQLRFHGGKGVAAGYGAVLGLAPLVAGAMWGVFLPITLLLRSSTLGGLTAFVAAPLLALAFSAGTPATVSFALLALIVIFTHRQNLMEEFLPKAASASSNASPQKLP